MRLKTQFLPGFYRQILVVAAALLLLGLSPVCSAGAATDVGKPKMVELWQPGDRGQRMRIRGRFTTIDGSSMANVAIYFRHADSEGINWSYHRGYVHTNEKGLYQFGSVIPGNSHRLSHVHVVVDHPGYEYLDTEFHFKHDPRASPDDLHAIFLEESNVEGETMMYGRYDITLIPR